MNKIGNIEWYALQPNTPHQFYGTMTDWNETIWIKINQGNATLVQNSLKNLPELDYEVPAKSNPKKKLIIASDLVELITSLDTYNGLIERYNVAYSKKLEKSTIQLIDGDDYIEIKIINEHSPTIVTR